MLKLSQETRFLVLFTLILGCGFALVSLRPVDQRVIEPFTGWVAWSSGAALDLLGQDMTREGTVLRNDRFAVNIRNGCNGVETMIIFLAAVLSFSASWRARAAGLALGLVAIQAANMVRIVVLFLTGAYSPRFFDTSHTVVWQTIIILFGVLLWLFWANHFATARGRHLSAHAKPCTSVYTRPLCGNYEM